MSAEHDAAGRPRRASVQERELAVEERLRALATDLDDGPAPDFRAATRARLVAMAAVRTPEPAPRRGLARLAPSRRRSNPWRARLAATVAGVAMAVTALGTLVALSSDAQPGDVLYGLKRGTEQTQLALAGDERGLTLLEFATTRLQELDALVGATGGAPPADLVRDTLATMDAQTTEGAALVLTTAVEAADAAPLTVLGGWAQQQGTGLSDIRAALPAEAGTSIALVEQVGSRAAALQTALTCPSGPATAGRDALGPLPGECGAAPAAPPAPAPPTAPAPGTGTPSAEPPAGQTPAVPPAVPAPSSATGGAPVPAPAPAPPGGAQQSPSAPTGGSGPQTPAPTPRLPLPPLPVPGGTGPTTSSPSPGPLVDLPLPICVWPLVC
ncbi:DUF5667 domain-containing protein [Geodermatophilus sp. SYSU D01106]